MPVPYSEVPYKQLMCHQGAYDLIDLAGRKNISRWDIKEFEKFSLNADSVRKYVPSGFTTREAEQYIIKALEYYSR